MRTNAREVMWAKLNVIEERCAKVNENVTDKKDAVGVPRRMSIDDCLQAEPWAAVPVRADGGRVDERCLKNSGDTKARLNERITVGSNEVHRLMLLIRSLTANI
jgi:hypothetical protein